MDLITYALCKKHGGESITYTLTADTENKTIVLTPSEGTAQVITVPYATDASTVNGHEVPELENGKIPANFLPSFVDNVDEYDNISLFPVVGESNRIYIDKSTNKTYRWSGTAYVEISESIALGETSSTAYRGDRGKIAYDHSQSAHAPSNAEANQNAFSNVKIDSDIINASTKTDTLEFIAGDNIILTPNVSNKKITVSQAPVRKTASGNIASFSDGAGYPFLKVKANINPVQDLHGYDYPWVGGAGKNKINVADMHITRQVTIDAGALPAGTFVASATVKNNSNIGGQIQIRTDPQTPSSAVASASISDVSGTNRVATNSFTLSEPTNISIVVSGASSGYDFDMSQVQIELGSTATSYAPYSNICPISGFTGVNVAVTGKNLLDINAISEIKVSDTAYRNGVLFDKAGTYTVSAQNSGGYLYCRTFDADGTIKTTYNVVSQDTITNATFTISNGEYFTVYDAVGSTPLAVSIQRFEGWQVQVEKNSSATSYEAHNRHVYPISWQDEAGIVYGGYIDLVSGRLVVTMVGVDLGTLTWDYDSSYLRMFARLASMKQAIARTLELMCSQYRTISDGRVITNVPNGSVYNAVDNNVSTIFVHDTAYTSSVAFKTAVSGVQLVYPLETPQTYQLTPQQINTLIGQNNAWNNTNGQTEVEYKAPFYNDLTTKNEVQALINESITSALNASY